ncbi:MAG TPA: hypothetical protein VM144_06225 [Aestuariivirga sp.]|nr:hypothetical protein [Aestuariivirga sp.]
MTSAPVNAAGLCNCCATGIAESCSSVCAPVKPATGQCVAKVDYAGEAVIADGDNPLYGISLLTLDLKDAVRPELEGVRRLLEDSRRGVEKDRKISALDFRKGKIDDAALAVNTKRYEDAIVNYYLGLRVYRDRLAAVPRPLLRSVSKPKQGSRRSPWRRHRTGLRHREH